MAKKEENNEEYERLDIFISALPDCEKEVKIIFNELEKYSNEDYFEYFNIVGNRYVKSLLPKNSYLNKNKEGMIDTSTDDELLSLFIGIVGKENKDSKYPNINIESDYSNLLEKEYMEYYIIFSKEETDKEEINNIEFRKFKDSMDERLIIDKYKTIDEFKDILTEEVENWIEETNEDMEEIKEMMENIFMNMESSDSETEAKEMLEEIIKKGMGFEDSDETPEEVHEEIEEFLENFESNDDKTEIGEMFDSLNETDEIFNLLKKNYVISDDTFNDENIIINFEEYLLVNFIEMTKFLEYENEDDDKQLYHSGTIFSEKLDNILELFNKRVIKNPEFIKIKENDKDFIKKTGNDEIFETFKGMNNVEMIQPMFNSMIVYIKGLNEIAKEDTIDAEEYDKVLSKFIANLESTVKNFQIIEETIKTIENS